MSLSLDLNLFSSCMNVALVTSRVTGDSLFVVEENGSWGSEDIMQNVINIFSIVLSFLHWNFWKNKSSFPSLPLFSVGQQTVCHRTWTLWIPHYRNSGSASSSTKLGLWHLHEIQRLKARKPLETCDWTGRLGPSLSLSSLQLPEKRRNSPRVNSSLAIPTPVG